ncbi:MAG: potassium channel protein [Chloroflexi bacterium]|nr:potassium channel protein [Chloroflexota bacterium]
MVSTTRTRISKRLSPALIALVAVLIVGTVGFVALEQMDWLDALYMTVITISTVGFGEIKTLSHEGRLFTIGLIFAAALITFYAASVITNWIASGEWREQLERERERRMMKQLKNHTIVCGYGRVGRHVVHTLLEEKMPFVVIDPDANAIAHLRELGHMALHGNAADESILKQACIERARAIVVAVNSDAENVFIVLTARGICPDLQIIARANYETSESKLVRAGANHVISPYRIAGRRMVTTLIRPAVADFLDEVAHVGNEELLIEQVLIAPNSSLVGKTLAQAQLTERIGVTLLACKMPNAPTRTTPSADMVLQANMQMLALGSPEQLRTLLKMAGECA